MITVLASWLVLFLGLCGAGALALSLLVRLTGGGAPGRQDLFRLFWLGVGATIAAAQLWNLLAPLGAGALAAWLLAAAGGLALLLPRLRAPPGAPPGAPARRRPASRLAVWALLVAAGLFLLYLGAAGVATPRWSRAYDTDLYHFNVLRWMNEFAVVPGLGNLHSRLAHTSGFLVLAALVDNLWWDRATAWLLHGLFVSTASLQWLWMILTPPRGAGRRPRLFCLLTLPYLVRLQATIHPTLYYDEAALVVQLVLALEALHVLPWRWREPASGAERPATVLPDVIVLALLGALGFSLKPMGAIGLLFGALAAAAGVAGLRQRFRLPARRVAAAAAAAGLLPLLLLAGHVARNLILTGWLAFPAPLGRIGVDWAMPREPADDTHAGLMQSVRGQYDVIKAWARKPGAADYRQALDGGRTAWLPGWRVRQWRGIERHVFHLGLLFWLLHLAGLARSRADDGTVRADTALLLLAGASLLFWFLSAPDMRFGRALFWIWTGVGGSLLFSRPRLPAAVAGLAAGLLAAGALLSMSVPLTPRRPASWRGVGRAVPRPTAAVTIRNGQVPPLVVRVPLKGDQCGDSPLPATPYPLPTLLLREPGRLQSGFRRAP